MLYIVPGMLAGIVFYLILTVVNWFVEGIWPKNRRLRAHSRLAIHCLAAIAFTIFLVVSGGGGNWATHLQISGFLLAGCLLSFITSIRDNPRIQREENTTDYFVER
ncbi:hypothetical protein EU799_05280 [Corynebacterium silvaticum]|uniref:Uncharacterized protein n=1 Tax=Corynebacterium silvaticum TaxID=2320431 RepID=A0A7U5K716_9CORY|nr:hypothetical protein EU802_05100 [Corynebacterium silvaticum]TFA96410.1 hypothetical protein EU799_05280 [Corynebacterium silvaticum]TNX84304.1 hypothetical protein FIT55_07175 [Corynebacterium silvaticum]TRM16326.1 hypothetical protein ET810_005100 [Corynebacterium silvaticum]